MGLFCSIFSLAQIPILHETKRKKVNTINGLIMSTTATEMISTNLEFTDAKIAKNIQMSSGAVCLLQPENTDRIAFSKVK